MQINFKKLFTTTAFFVAESLFPRHCFNCGRVGQWYCADCRRRLPSRQERYCLICRRDNLWHRVCADCGALTALLAAYDYKLAPIQSGIKACKYQFASTVGIELGELLAVYVCAQSELARVAAQAPVWLKSFDNVLVVPVPLARRRYNWRGFNQAEVIATVLARDLNLVLNTDLVRSRETIQQTTLSGLERLTNLQSAFSWRGATLQGKTIWLVDDVSTTGTTLNEAATVLKKAGATRVIGLVLAHG